MNIGSTLKTLVRRCLPRPLRRLAKKLYYPGVLARFREDQWPPASAVRRLVKPGDVVVDAGANIGYVTCLLSRWVGPDGRVVSIEPVPETFGILSSNIRKLGLRNVELHNCALSAEDGEGRMQVPSYDSGGENFYEARVVGGEGPAPGSLEVRLRRLDDIVAGVEKPVAFVKMDVEGHEWSAIRGCAWLIRRWRPAFLIELSEGPDRALLFRFMEDEGYDRQTTAAGAPDILFVPRGENATGGESSRQPLGGGEAR